MAGRTLGIVILTAALALTNVTLARAEPLPAPTTELKDYDARGYIQIDLPPPSRTEGKKDISPGIQLWFPLRQAYVRPDTLFLDMEVTGVRQRILVKGNAERTYTPGTPYVIERVYKNLDQAPANPMATSQMAMVELGRVFRELNTAKITDDGNLEQEQKDSEARIKDLSDLRTKLDVGHHPENLPQEEAAALESARLRDMVLQVPVRKAHPCFIAEFPNKDLMRVLFSRGLVGEAAQPILEQGKTRVWCTKAEGLPILVETTANDGHVAIHMCLVDLKINTGLHPSELLLGTAPGTRLLQATGDVRDRNYAQKMEKDIQEQVAALEAEQRKQRNRGGFAPPAPLTETPVQGKRKR